MNSGTGISQLLGAALRPLTASEQSSFGIRNGLIITDTGNGALAKKTNIRKGFVIISANDEAVSKVDDLQKSMLANSGKLQIGGFYPGQQGMYYYGINSAGEVERVE